MRASCRLISVSSVTSTCAAACAEGGGKSMLSLLGLSSESAAGTDVNPATPADNGVDASGELTVRQGTAKRNVVPFSASLSQEILPCISSTSRLQMDSPSPVPPYFRLMELSAWLNGWNSRACC